MIGALLQELTLAIDDFLSDSLQRVVALLNRINQPLGRLDLPLDEFLGFLIGVTFQHAQVTLADAQLGNVLFDQRDDPLARFVLVDPQVGRDGLDRFLGEAFPRKGIERPHLLHRRLDLVQGIPGLPFDQRESILEQVVEVERDQRDHRLAEWCFRLDLQQEALFQIAGPDTGWIELLNQPENILSPGQRHRLAEDLRQFRQRALQSTVVVEVLDQILAESTLFRIDVEVVELIDQIVSERLRPALRVRHHVVLTIGVVIHLVAGGTRTAGVIVFRPLLRDFDEPLKVTGIVVFLASDQFLTVDLHSGCDLERIASLFQAVIPVVCFSLHLLQAHILRQFLIDALLQCHQW